MTCVSVPTWSLLCLCFTASPESFVTALRKPLEAHSEHFWGLLAKWLSGGLWRLICSQEVSGGSFAHFWILLAKWLSGGLWKLISAFLGPADQIALRRLLEVHFEHFWGPLAQMALRRFLEPHSFRAFLEPAGHFWFPAA